LDTGDDEEETGQIIYEIVDDYNYYYRTNYKKRHSKYLAAQVVLIKRLSNRWMTDTSFTLSSWKRYYEGEYTDPHNISHFDEAVNANMNSRWQFKSSGLYQLPFGGINIGWVFRARDGYVIQPYVKEERPGLGQSTFYKGKRGDDRMPSFYELDFRLEKVFHVLDNARVIISVDAFNALNNHHELNRDELITSDRFNTVNKILNPRVFRFGVRFDF
jgi:hypothetical protein